VSTHGYSACQRRSGLVDLDHALFQAIFRHGQAIGAEGVGLDHIHADFKERAVDFFHGFGIRNDQVIVAAI